MNISENIQTAASKRGLSFCYKKVAEELFELGEVVMKQLNKPEGVEERIPHLVEELGDVVLNILILSSKLDLDIKIWKRIETKLKTLI